MANERCDEIQYSFDYRNSSGPGLIWMAEYSDKQNGSYSFLKNGYLDIRSRGHVR